MDAYNPVATPLEASAKLSKNQSPSSEKEESEMANIPYRRAVGSFMYCMVGTRLDIAATVGVVAQFFTLASSQKTFEISIRFAESCVMILS
jgi:hypothetical protein